MHPSSAGMLFYKIQAATEKERSPVNLSLESSGANVIVIVPLVMNLNIQIIWLARIHKFVSYFTPDPGVNR